MSSFTKPAIVRIEEPPFFIFEEEFVYYRTGDKNDIITVPKGFKTNFASIPRFLWSLLPPTGTRKNHYFKSAAIHDLLYDLCCDYSCTRKEADKIMLEAMTAIGISKIVKYVLYYSARLFGRSHFKTENNLIK